MNATTLQTNEEAERNPALSVVPAIRSNLTKLEKPRKSGQPNAPMTRLKELWRDSMSEATRDDWRKRLWSDRKNEELLAEIAKELGIELCNAAKVTVFRNWVADQDERNLREERAEENRRRYEREHADWTKEQVRDELIKQAYFECHASGDFRKGMDAIRTDVKLEALEILKQRFKEGTRTKLEAGLAELAKYINGSAAAKAAYETFRATIKEAMK